MIDVADKIARAILYEGHLLYPYRRSALKNQQPWTFGTLAPESWGEDDPSTFELECLAVVTPQARLSIVLRFLHLSRSTAPNVEASRIAYGPSMERSMAVDDVILSDLAAQPRTITFHIPGSDDESFVWTALSGRLEVFAEALPESGMVRVRMTARNVTELSSNTRRGDALLCSLVSAHAALSIHNGEFISLLDFPPQLAEAAARCRNIGVYPVLVGDPQRRDQMLASPIILYDYPEIASESPGDYFDATEIDEMLALRVLTLTDDEKKEMRDAGEQARAILERTEMLPPEQLQKIHGAIRGVRRSEGPK